MEVELACMVPQRRVVVVVVAFVAVFFLVRMGRRCGVETRCVPTVRVCVSMVG